ncbi:MAG: cyclic nucleotide-binding domain-containing protein [Verrucomicrobia bacterium]|nr:cyclic nucleotide-binding domain-containing protein [Verrucomicrobiota bacterium]
MTPSLNDQKLRLSRSLERKDLPDGTRLLKQTNCGEYLALNAQQEAILAEFDGQQTVQEVLQGLLHAEGHPKIRAFYDLVLAAREKGFLHEGESEPISRQAKGRRWNVRCTPTGALALALCLIGAGASAVAVSEVSLIPTAPGWFLTLLSVSLGLSLANVLAGAVLSGLGREVYRPEVRLDLVLPFFSVDTRDALMGGRRVEALAALQMLAAPFGVALVGWTLDSTPVFLAGYVTALLLASPFGGSPAHALLHALFRKQHELPRCADTFLNQKFLAQLFNWKESLTEERYFIMHSTWALVWLGAVFRFASELMARQASVNNNVLFEPGAQTVIYLLMLVVAAPLAYLLWLVMKAAHRLLAPSLFSTEGKLNFDGGQRPGPDETVKFLSSTLLFSQLSEAELRPVAEAMEFFTVKPGARIIRERDRGDLMFVLYRGRVEVQKEDEAGSLRPVAQLGRGEVFGEIALLQQVPRTSSVVALDATELFALKKEDFDRLLLSTLGAKKIQEVVQVCAFLRRNSIFADWPPHALMKVAGQFTFQDCAAGAEVLSEGRHNESFYIVYEGEFGVRKAGAQVATLGPGDFCGEISLLQGTAASANVAALRNSRCLKLGKDSFLQLVSRDFLTGMAIERTSDKRVVALKKKKEAAN